MNECRNVHKSVEVTKTLRKPKKIKNISKSNKGKINRLKKSKQTKNEKMKNQKYRKNKKKKQKQIKERNKKGPPWRYLAIRLKYPSTGNLSSCFFNLVGLLN